MSREQWQDRIALYFGGDLPESEAALLKQHLAACTDCASLAEILADDRALLRSRPPELAEVDFDGMRRDLKRQIVRNRRVMRWAPVVAVAAALLVAAILPRTTEHRIVRSVDRAIEKAPAVVPPIKTVAKMTDDKKRSPVPPDVEMYLTTADPDVTIVLLPVTMENPHE